MDARAAADLLAGLTGPVGVAVAPDGFALAHGRQTWVVDGPLGLLTATPARLVWWRAATTGRALVAAGVRPRSCWDLAAVARVLHGRSREDPGAVWAVTRGLPEPPAARGELSLLDLDDGHPVGTDGQLSAEWCREQWYGALDRAARWAALALELQTAQAARLAALTDPRRQPTGPALATLTAYAESAAALLAVELGHDGLPVDRATLVALLHDAIGPPPDDRARRDAPVLALTGGGVDLRNPAQVRDLLAARGIDVPDTRSWRLEPHRATSPLVAALLDWRRAERIATTYGYGWVERHVGADDRLRGQWTAAEGAGRMTASAGLHNLPADLRPAVAARPGHVLVRADLGQVEPRVLAVVSGDDALAGAAGEDDMYAPVAVALGADRPTAKVAVLAAMYGQTSGPAGAALQRMERAYPTAMAFLRAAEEVGREGGELRTWGGRLLHLPGGGPADDGRHGRYARNAVVQGAAAELFKVWAVTVRAALPHSIVLCLHDELVLEVPSDRADDAVAILHRGLTEASGRWAGGSPVRFLADVAVVPRWSDAKT